MQLEDAQSAVAKKAWPYPYSPDWRNNEHKSRLGAPVLEIIALSCTPLWAWKFSAELWHTEFSGEGFSLHVVTVYAAWINSFFPRPHFLLLKHISQSSKWQSFSFPHFPTFSIFFAAKPRAWLSPPLFFSFRRIWLFVFSFCWLFVPPVSFCRRPAVSFCLSVLICRAFAAGETTSTANWGKTKARASEKPKLKYETKKKNRRGKLFAK